MDKQKRHHRKKALAVLSAVFVSCGAAGADLFVAPGGSGTGCSITAPCSLQTALSSAVDNDVIFMKTGTFTGSGTEVIKVTKDLSIFGGWDGLNTLPPHLDPVNTPTVIDAEGARRGLDINGSITVQISGLSVKDGNASGLLGYSYYGDYDAGGGIYVNGASGSISDCIIQNSTSGKTSGSIGGGIALVGSTVTLSKNVIRNNIALTGAALAVHKGSPVIEHNHVYQNSALSGGGGGGMYIFDSSSCTISKNIIEENNATLYGGGISAASATVTIEGNMIMNNRTDNRGGAVRLWYGGNSLLLNNIIRDNFAGSEGSAIWSHGSNPIIEHNTVVNNTGGDGSGVYLDETSNGSVINTIIAGHTLGITVAAGGSVDLNGTLWGNGVWANGADTGGAGTVNLGTNNITGNPAFKDPANGDYHITGVSAAVNAGIVTNVTEDIDGDPRPRNGGYDIGADEIGVILAPIYYLFD